MESNRVADTLSTLPAAHFDFWTTAQPMAGFQAAWPGFPPTTPYEAPVPRPSYVASAGLVIPCFYNRVTEKPSAKENRKFLLNRSVFDLVDAHPYLALTDPNLLGWYLCLSPGDRKIIQDEGGLHQFLQRHPALQLSRHHVYVKYNIGSASPVQPSVTSHKQITSGAKSCRCGTLDADPQLDVLPNNVTDTLTLFGCNNNRDGSQEDPGGSEQQVHLQDSFNKQEAVSQKAHSARMANSSSSASFSLDTEREGLRRGSQISVTQGQSVNFTYAEVSPLQSNRSTVEKDSPPEYYSCDSVQMGGKGFSDGSTVQSAQLDPAEGNSTKERCQDYMVCGDTRVADDNEATLSFGDQSDNLQSVMEDDKSILACLASEGAKAVASSSETADRYASPEPGVTTCDMVGTEKAPCTSASTQTENPRTSDKHVITEVHMADLDYLTEEFIKLKLAKEELRKQNEKMKSLGGKLRKDCECVQRAQHAELSLLALQYSMCRQHCWRLYYTCAEGGQLTPMLKNPPANIVSVQQKLESDYNEMREKILAGVPLEQLEPLSVDSEKITAGESYIPAQILGDVLGNVSSWSSLSPKKFKSKATGLGYLSRKTFHLSSKRLHQSGTGPSLVPGPVPAWSDALHELMKPLGWEVKRLPRQLSQRKEKQMKKVNSKARRAVTLVPQDRDTVDHACKPEEKQSTACKERNTSEVWYDAEEELEAAGPAESADKTNEPGSDEAKSSLLSVSNLHSEVTESDVMLWLEKYQVSDVSVAALKDDLRVAMVMMSGRQSAEAAVRELNGCSVQGHSLHVEHISRAIGGSQSQSSASVSRPESSQESDSCSSERKLITQPLLSSGIKNRKVVCISPTAKGTCVPQHYGTMGSFDALMAELMQHHPDVGRQRIVDALMELKSRHQGALSSLPLATIRDMTSELLTRPSSGEKGEAINLKTIT